MTARLLLETDRFVDGWSENHLRMVVASFLCYLFYFDVLLFYFFLKSFNKISAPFKTFISSPSHLR